MNSYWQENLCIESHASKGVLVIFGASGDLTRNKLLIALYKLFKNNLIPKESLIIACARMDFNRESYQKYVRATLIEQLLGDDFDDDFLALFHYQKLVYDVKNDYELLKNHLQKLNVLNSDFHFNYYLATPPFLYQEIVENLSACKLLEEDDKYLHAWRHVIFEKPFGFDFASARELDNQLHKYLRESQIYRIDHYLGKDTIQNIFMLRFANIIFGELWNYKYIEHVKITVFETQGVGKRISYFEKSGLLRDMFQNHLLAILSIIAMEIPVSFEPNFIRDEKIKLIKSIRPFDLKNLSKSIIRGQYESYLQEENVAPNSNTETYVASKLYIDNWRWQNVPFYLKCGKKMAEKYTEIAIVFKKVPHSIFAPLSPNDLEPNVLTLKIQNEESMSLSLQGKKSGPKLCIGTMNLHFDYPNNYKDFPLDAYARLLHDAQLGDQTLFLRSDLIAESWKLFDGVIDAFKHDQIPLYRYADGINELPESFNI